MTVQVLIRNDTYHVTMRAIQSQVRPSSESVSSEAVLSRLQHLPNPSSKARILRLSSRPQSSVVLSTPRADSSTHKTYNPSEIVTT